MLSSLLLTGLLIAASAFDLKVFRIPNAISLAVIALFLIKAAAMTEIAVWPDHVIAFGLMIALGFLAFAFGLVGGGDAKLMMALALWFGMTALPSLLAITAIGGGLFALILVSLRYVAARFSPAVAASGTTQSPRLLNRKAPVPYALPITVAALWLEWH
jgi:prepilin peptidase CpaA